MDSVSLSSSSRAALNVAGGEGVQGAAVSALKIAAQSEQAIVQVVQQAAEAQKALPQAGQGQNVDKLA
jgi:secreted protein with Ig-like and vWFA domain